MAEEGNDLVSTKPSDSPLKVALHPLVLLTISDQITRHQVRKESGFVVGALLGQVNGRNLTIEHAFPCNLIQDGQNVLLHNDWFTERLQQYKEVHKLPALDLVGWFTVSPETGPTVAQLPIHQQISAHNDSPLLLAFHPSVLTSMASSTTGKLPFTLYESVDDREPGVGNESRSKETNAMQLDQDESQPPFKFRVLPYTVETEETEMIGVDHIAKGGGNATVIETSTSEPSNSSTRKGKRRGSRAVEDTKQTDVADAQDNATLLSSEDEDMIATLTTRLNSVRMLQSRISLLQKFIQSLPPSYLSSTSEELTTTNPPPSSLPALRQVSSLVTRLSLLTPSPIVTSESSPNTSTSQPAATTNLTATSNDVNLTALLSLLGRNIQGVHELGRKFSAGEAVKTSQKSRSGLMGQGGGRFGFMDPMGGVESELELL